MEAKTLKYLKIGGYIVGGAVVLFGAYKGGKYLLDKFKPGETGGADKTITLSDGTQITISSEKAKNPDAVDILNLQSVLLKWVQKGRINSLNSAALVEGSKKISKYEFQNFMYLLDKGNPSLPIPYGLTVEEEKKLIALIKSIALASKK